MCCKKERFPNTERFGIFVLAISEEQSGIPWFSVKRNNNSGSTDHFDRKLSELRCYMIAGKMAGDMVWMQLVVKMCSDKSLSVGGMNENN